MAEGGVPADQPTVLHLTHQKAGSQWAYQVLASAAPGRIVRALPDGAQFGGPPVIPGMIYPALFETRERVDAVDIPGPQRRVFVMRDLRDTLVSLYFSFRYSHHDQDLPAAASHIAALQDLTDEEGLRRELHLPLRRIARIQLSWVDADVPVVRYEELVADEVEGFGRLLAHCGLQVGERRLRGLLAPASFEARGGRPRGVEDLSSHNRKGIVGDWRNHLSGDVLDEFKAAYDEVLIATGYERNADWGASPAAAQEGRRRRRRLRGPRCWCGGVLLRRFAPGFDRCRRCETLVGTAHAPVPDDRLWTDVRFHHEISRPKRAWRGAPLERPQDAWDAATIERLETLLRWVPPGGKVLDAAAGTGALAAMLAGAGFRVTALEADEAAAGYARDAWGLDVRASGVADEAGPFDAIVLVDALGREADPLGLLKTCAERLAGGGSLLVDQPLWRGEGSIEQLRHDGSEDVDLLRPEYAYVFSASSLDRLLEKAGLAVRHRVGTLRVAGGPGSAAAPERPRSGVALVEGLIGVRRELDMELRRWQDERALLVAQQEDLLDARDPRLVADRLGFGAGWHALEHQAGEAFRWAGEDPELRIGRPSGRRSTLVLEVEAGPGVGGRAYELELLDEHGARLARVDGPRARGEVRLSCPVAPGRTTSVTIRAEPGGLPTPGADQRILNFRLFSLGWE